MRLALQHSIQERDGVLKEVRPSLWNGAVGLSEVRSLDAHVAGHRSGDERLLDRTRRLGQSIRLRESAGSGRNEEKPGRPSRLPAGDATPPAARRIR